MKRFNLAFIAVILSLGLHVSTAQAGLLEGQVGIVEKGAPYPGGRILRR